MRVEAVAAELLRVEVELEVERPDLGRVRLAGEGGEHRQRAGCRLPRRVDEEHLLLGADAPDIGLEAIVLEHLLQGLQVAQHPADRRLPIRGRRPVARLLASLIRSLRSLSPFGRSSPPCQSSTSFHELVQVAGEHRPPERPVVGPVADPTSRPGWGCRPSRSRWAARHDSPMSSLAPSPLANTTNRVRTQVEVAASRWGSTSSGDDRRSRRRRGRRRSGAAGTCRSCRRRRGTCRAAGRRRPRALNAPIDAPAASSSMSGDPQSARTAGTSSWAMNSKNWRCIQAWWPASPSPASIARPLTLSTEYSLTRPASSSSAQASDEVEALDLLGVAASGGEHEHGAAVVAPAHDVDLAFEPAGVPARRQLAAHSSLSERATACRPGEPRRAGVGGLCWRQRWIRSQKRSVNKSTSWAGNSASTFWRTAP